MKTRLRLELNGTILNHINPVNELRVGVNGTTLNNSIPVNEQPKKNINNILETVFHEPIINELSKIPQMKQKLQDGKITAKEYNTELRNLKDRLHDIVNRMNIMRDNIKAQDKKIENESINSSTAIKYIEDNMEEMEQYNKDHLKETLKIKSKAHANEYDIRGIQREVEKYSLKLNASNGKLGGVWQLHSDDKIYPILKQDKMNHWSKYNDNLKNVKLEDDTLMELEKK